MSKSRNIIELKENNFFHGKKKQQQKQNSTINNVQEIKGGNTVKQGKVVERNMTRIS